MLNITYRINKGALIDCNFSHEERPVIYGVFVIKSDFGLSLRDLSFIDDDLFELFDFNDDLFLWFLNIALMNVEILKNEESNFIIGYDLDNLPPYHAILFQRINNLLDISKVKYLDENYSLFVFSKDLPKNLEIHEKYSEIFISEWINESVYKTRSFISELISYNQNFKELEYVKLIEESLNFIDTYFGKSEENI